MLYQNVIFDLDGTLVDSAQLSALIIDQMLAERGIARQVRPDGERIDEEADKRFQILLSSIGNGRTDHHVHLPRVAGKQCVESLV